MCKDLPGRPVFPHGVFSMRVSLAQTTTQNIGTDRKDRRQCSAAMATIRISYSYQASWRRRNAVPGPTFVAGLITPNIVRATWSAKQDNGPLRAQAKKLGG